MLASSFKLLFPFTLLLLLGSCELINPEEPIPAYLQIDSVVLKPNPEADAGSLSHNIVDAWVLVDDELLGIHELPARIPILESGEHKLTIGPGIYISPYVRIRENYDFYTAYTDPSFEFKPGETVEVTPEVTYRSEGDIYEYIVVEDFERSFINVDSFSGSQVPIVKTTDPALVFEGTGSGLMDISKENSLALFRTPEYVLPAALRPVFLEIDYKTDFSITIGVFVDNIDIQNRVIDYITLTPTTDEDDEWRKAYIELTSITSDGTNNPRDYFLYFSARIESANLQKDGKFLIDNIKLMYQK